MRAKLQHPELVPILSVILGCFLCIALLGNKAATAYADQVIFTSRKTVIIDPGHGGVDGGATSCSGVLESHINLEISLRLRDLMHLLGMKTAMIRTSDISVYTEGETIAAKKISDLKQRVKIVNGTDNAILLSIHQNYFTDSRYRGAQVFYAKTVNSQALAEYLQKSFRDALEPDNHRQAKPCENVYLMKHIQCPGILVECGFLSNPVEEAMLRSENYQKKLCTVIAASLSEHLYNNIA